MIPVGVRALVAIALLLVNSAAAFSQDGVQEVQDGEQQAEQDESMQSRARRSGKWIGEAWVSGVRINFEF